MVFPSILFFVTITAARTDIIETTNAIISDCIGNSGTVRSILVVGVEVGVGVVVGVGVGVLIAKLAVIEQFVVTLLNVYDETAP